MTDANEARQQGIPLEEVRTLLAEKDRIVAELSDRAANLAVEVTRRDKRLAVQEQILAEKEARIAELEAVISKTSLSNKATDRAKHVLDAPGSNGPINA